MRRTQSLEFSGAYYIRIPPRCGRKSKKKSTSGSRLCLFFRGKGIPVLYTILPPHGKISRRKTNTQSFFPKRLHAVNFPKPLQRNVTHPPRRMPPPATPRDYGCTSHASLTCFQLSHRYEPSKSRAFPFCFYHSKLFSRSFAKS